MPIGNLVLRTVYVDPDVDAQLRDEALASRVSKADLFRRYLVSGIKAVKTHPALFETAASLGITPALVLRTVHMDPKLDSKLCVEAFDSRISKNDLMRRYVRVGMCLNDTSAAQESGCPVRTSLQQGSSPAKVKAG